MMHCRACVFILYCALSLQYAVLLALALHGQARREPRTLSGNVYIAGGNRPAENVSVELHSSEGGMIAPQITDANGWFDFHGLERAVYAIVIHEPGFEPLSLNFDLFFNSSRGNAIYLVPLEKNSDSHSQAGHISAHELSMPEKARELMRSGRKKLYQDKNAQGSLADFEAAVVEAPNYYEAWCQMAMAYLTIGKRDEAEKSFRRSLEQSKGTYGEAQIGLGTVALDKGNSIEGERLIRRGIELSPDSWMGHYELSRALLNENRVAEAKESAELARSLAPSTPVIYRLLSNIHLREKDYPALLSDWDTYIQLDPDSPAGARAKELRIQVQQEIAAGIPP